MKYKTMWMLKYISNYFILTVKATLDFLLQRIE